MTDATSDASADRRADLYNLAVIGGDGIGPEVVAEGLKVLEAVDGTAKFSITTYDLGASRWQRTGEVLPDSVLAELAEADVILLGAVGAAPGAQDVPSGLLERGLLLKLRFAFDHYVNLRPSRLYPGRADPARRLGRRRQGRSTSSSSARAPRGCTAATAAWCAPAPRPRSRPR